MDADGFEGDAARPQGHDDAEEDEQLTASGPVEDPSQHPDGGDEQDEGEGPWAWGLFACDRDEGDRREILEDEDRDGDLTVVGPVVGTIFEHLDHEHRRGE